MIPPRCSSPTRHFSVMRQPRRSEWRSIMPAAFKFSLFWLTAATAAAQWLNYPTKGTPRTPDGKPDLTAPTPRRPDGKPELTGVWMGVTKYMINIAADLKEDVPFQPWAAAEYKRRRDSESKDDPSARCL